MGKIYSAIPGKYLKQRQRLEAILLTIIFFWVASNVCKANSSDEINGKYLVRFSSPSLSTVRVECQIPVKGSVKMSLVRTENLENGWATFVKNLKMNAPDGKEVKFEKTNKNEWRLENNYAGVLHISYDVDFSFARKPWVTGNHTAAYYNGKALFMVGRALFVYSDELNQARVEFNIPKGMKVSTPWRRERENTFITGGKFLVLHNLADNTLVVGEFVEKVVETGGFRLQICLLDSITESSELVSSYMQQILAEFIKIFGRQEKSIYQITIFEAKGDGGESYLNSFAAVMSKPPAAEGAVVWANTLAHEFFHYWNGLRISGGLEGYFGV
jgi:predicted metalloprotease with PDZ domain